ncbi:MAG: hypothetical protein JO056_11560 [Alphaproteobacteria bacterium]|nr:hypothetical protein [Alphaproteobacteria bacterium]
MDKLTTTLLTGAALTAFAAAPAAAGGWHLPKHMPKMAVMTAKGAIVIGDKKHQKTLVANGSHHPSTFTFTFTYYSTNFTFAASTAYKTPKQLGGFAWYTVSSGGHCVNFVPQKAKAVALGGNGKAKVTTFKSHVTIGSCTGTLTFYSPQYTLKSKVATSSNVDLNDIAQVKTSYTTTTTTAGGKHKKHKHKNKYNFKGGLHEHLTFTH